MEKASASRVIPPELRKFFHEVSLMIHHGSDVVSDESDDAIQFPDYNVCGGLWDVEAGIYGFTYWEKDPEHGPQWEMQLDASAIHRIASGETLLAGWACSHPDCGNFFTDKDGYCHYCDNPLGRESVIEAEKELKRDSEAFNSKYGDEFNAALARRVAATREMPPGLFFSDRDAYMKLVHEIDAEYEATVDALFRKFSGEKTG